MKPRDMWKKAANTKDMLKKATDKPRRTSVSGQKRHSYSLGRPESPEDGLSPANLPSPADDYCAEKDTDLFVGPVYDNSSRRQNVIKEELGEITKRLHRTLKDFDTIEEFEESPQKKILHNMSRRISKLENSEMKSELESFLSEYQNLTSTYEEASKERDEILLDLADWFTTDHTDIDHTLGLDESEETEIKNSYVETLADFEKLKRLTETIKQNGSQGKKVKHLKEEKKKLEKSVVAGFKNMNQRKSISVQTQKPRDDTWKHAADEIMSMITNVRTESSAEMLALKNKITEMMNELQRQDLQINGLQSENRREKDLKKHLADENAELNSDIWNLRGKLVRYEKDLESAKKLIEKQFLELAQKKKSQNDVSESAESLEMEGKPSVTGILNQFFGEEGEGAGLTRMSSDPIILRTRVRELDGKIDQLAKDLVQANDKLEEYEEEFERMEEQTAEIQSENRRLSDKVDALQLLVEQVEEEKTEFKKAKLEAERLLSQLEADNNNLKRKSSSLSVHTCSHCNCHLKSVMSMPLLEEEAPVPLEKKVSDAEIQRLMDKCSNYRRTLAETELKLSNAYRDIAEMRLRRESIKVESVQTPKQESASVPSPETIAEESPEPEAESIADQSADQGDKMPVAKLREKGEIPHAKKEKPKKPIKPTAKREAPSTTLKKKESPVSLPPLKTPAPLPKEEPPVDKKDRELVLWHVGDLQGRLNMVIQEIMDYAKAAGDMLNKEEAEQASKLPVLTTFEFGNRDRRKKMTKEDPKETESKQQKAQIVLNGQRAVALMREIYDIMSHHLSLQHDEYEMIYRSFKANQHRRMIERAIMLGQLPPSALKEFREAQEAGLKDTCTIVSYGGHHNGPGGGTNQYGYHHGIGGPGGLTGYGAGGGGWVNPALASTSRMSDDTERQKLEGAVTVLGMQRSKSEVDVQSVMSDVSLPSGTLIRERSSVFMVHMPDSRAAMSRNRESIAPNREEIRVSKTVTPKKGLIKLTSLDYELKNQFVFENKALLEKERNQRKHRPTPQKMLIRRKDIVDQIKAGNKQLLEQEKSQEVDVGMEKQMGEYTFADLQMNIDKMTNKNTRRGFRGKIDPKKQHQEINNPNKERTTGLPQLNTVQPFGS